MRVMRMIEYDLVVIGSGPGGQKAAVASAKLGKKVAVIERSGMLGGVCVNTGTIPSKSMREAVVYLTGMNQHEQYGASYRVKQRITFADLHTRTEHVIKREIDVVRDQLMRNGIGLYTGIGRFVTAHTAPHHRCRPARLLRPDARSDATTSPRSSRGSRNRDVSNSAPQYS